MSPVTHLLFWICLFLLSSTDTSFAGMPVALPEDLQRYAATALQLNEEPEQRLQAISFFLLVLAASAGAILGLWGLLRKDFPFLPKMTFGRALGVIVLWGLIFVIVLTMISGARELMTPGAWKPNGSTYKLRESGDPTSPQPANDPLTPSVK